MRKNRSAWKTEAWRVWGLGRGRGRGERDGREVKVGRKERNRRKDYKRKRMAEEQGKMGFSS